MRLMRLGYRLLQFAERARVRRNSIDYVAARERLLDPAFKLFKSMSPGDQAHSLTVLALLESEGNVGPDLGQAALLHDSGKIGSGLSLAHRVVVVLLGGIAPSWLARLAHSDPHSWRHPFYRHLYHASLGATLCRHAGCSELTIALVANHDTAPAALPEGPVRDLLTRLKAADNAC